MQMYGKTVYAPGGDPLVWSPEYCADCGDDVGKIGSRDALEKVVQRVREALDVHDGYPVGQLEGVLFKTNAIRAAIDQEAKTDASEDHKPH